MECLVDQPPSSDLFWYTDDENSSLMAKVHMMSDPTLYRSSGEVERIETHFSWIFLVGGDVFKLKKSIKTSYLNLSTLTLRRQNCEAEVLLNQRLTHHVYLGIKALTLDPMGHVHLTSSPSSSGVLDFVVHQRRLHSDTGMDALLKKRSLGSYHLESLVHHLVEFYRRQSPVGWDGETYLNRLRSELEACFWAVEKTGNQLIPKPTDLINHLVHYVQLAGKDLASANVLSRIVEGHGDLRPEHVFFEELPQIIDCLEFSFELRCRDAMDELAYLAMECDILGYGDAGHYLLETFRSMAHIKGARHLEHFYAAFRALVRAKLVAWRLMNAPCAEVERWRRRLVVYWAMAERYAGSL